MIRSGPFARALQAFTAVAAAMQLALGPRQEALAGIQPYESHGKGSGKHQASSRRVAMDIRDARKARNVKRNRRQHNGK